MGVVVLQSYPVPADKTAAQVIDFIQKRIINLGANMTGPFLVDCETYHSIPAIANPPKTLHIAHNSEQPATVFSVLESNNKTITFTSDTLFDLLLLKLNTFYSKKLKIESKGSRFEIGDFIVKLGIVSASSSSKGILVEIEYLPCLIPGSCWGLIHEFMQGFLGSVISKQMPVYLERKANEIYTPVDTINQYLEQFSYLRKMNA
jgi:mediator of RNA polymerase II transcription subunit 20